MPLLIELGYRKDILLPSLFSFSNELREFPFHILSRAGPISRQNLTINPSLVLLKRRKYNLATSFILNRGLTIANASHLTFFTFLINDLLVLIVIST